MRKQRFLSGLLALVLALTLLPAAALAAAPGLSNFTKVNTYVPGTFTDVSGEWYAQNVQTAYELGLVLGTSDTTFSPDENISLAAALALACRLHSIYHTGSADFVQGDPWYQVYEDYAVLNGIISAGSFANYDVSATRRQFVGILAKALPGEALEEINTVADGAIPDVAAGSACYDDIYTLYRAGILSGNDSAGNFTPDSSIQRSGVAAIVTRMADPSLRQSVHLVPEAGSVTLSETALTLDVGSTAELTAAVSPEGADAAVTWTSSNPGVAGVLDGKVTAVSAGSAVITASTANGKTAACSVTVRPAPLVYSGSGDKVITGINIPAGAYYSEFTHDGSSNVMMKLIYGDRSYDYFLVANEIGASANRYCMSENGHAAIVDGMLEVKADGNWTIEFKPVSGTTTTNIKGSGNAVTGLFTASAARNIISGTHNGTSNFIVYAIKYNSRVTYDRELVFNEIGACSSQSVATLEPGQQYYISVVADGDWTLDFGQGDSVTTYTALPAPAPARNDNNDGNRPSGGYDDDWSGSDSSSNSDLWSYSEAKDLKRYADNFYDGFGNVYQTLSGKSTGFASADVKLVQLALDSIDRLDRQLSDAVALMRRKVDLELTGGSYDTLEDYVEAIRSRLRDMKDTEVDESNVARVKLELAMDAATVNAMGAEFRLLAAKLVAAF